VPVEATAGDVTDAAGETVADTVSTATGSAAVSVAGVQDVIGGVLGQ
jgi:hypothetical protein